MLRYKELKDELYNLSIDPYEQVNIISRIKKLRQLYRQFKKHSKMISKKDQFSIISKNIDTVEYEEIEKELKCLDYM
ncbi:MAG: hypothetical protein ACTSRZ_14505 [Promethearchaeota archaeon]